MAIRVPRRTRFPQRLSENDVRHLRLSTFDIYYLRLAAAVNLGVTPSPKRPLSPGAAAIST